MIGFTNLLVCTETSRYMEFPDETGQRTFRDESFIQNSLFYLSEAKNVQIAHG